MTVTEEVGTALAILFCCAGWWLILRLVQSQDKWAKARLRFVRGECMHCGYPRPSFECNRCPECGNNPVFRT